MRLQLNLPVEDYDALQDKLDSNKKPFVRLERRVFTLLLRDYEQLIDACQRVGIDVDVHRSVDLAPSLPAGRRLSDESDEDENQLEFVHRSR